MIHVALLVKKCFYRKLLRLSHGIIISITMSLFAGILVGSVLVFRVEGACLVDKEESVVGESGIHDTVQRVIESHVHLVARKSIKHV